VWKPRVFLGISFNCLANAQSACDTDLLRAWTFSSSTKDGQFYDAVADQIWPQGYHVLGNRGESYERRGVAERHRLFGMAVWLLQDWPHRFETCVRIANVRRSYFLSGPDGLPSWFVLQVQGARYAHRRRR
jgi:hypothetical protein